jgi:hypothetical protein
MVMRPGELPGASVPPASTVSAPVNEPVPVRKAPESTVTPPVPSALPEVLARLSVPVRTRVPPV